MSPLSLDKLKQVMQQIDKLLNFKSLLDDVIAVRYIIAPVLVLRNSHDNNSWVLPILIVKSFCLYQKISVTTEPILFSFI